MGFDNENNNNAKSALAAKMSRMASESGLSTEEAHAALDIAACALKYIAAYSGELHKRGVIHDQLKVEKTALALAVIGLNEAIENTKQEMAAR